MCAAIGYIVSEDKTKVVCLPATGTAEVEFWSLCGRPGSQMRTFVYLGQFITYMTDLPVVNAKVQRA